MCLTPFYSSADNLGGEDSAFIRFIGGEAALRAMTVIADVPCADDEVLEVLVHFTGESAFLNAAMA